LLGTDFARLKYGLQNVCNDRYGVAGDSAGLSAKVLGIPEYCAHILQKYSDPQLKDVIRAAQGGGPGDSRQGFEKLVSYQEVQIHGEIHLVESSIASAPSWMMTVCRIT